MYQRGGKVRFIPACAGNSRLATFQQRVMAVHPRVCGEQHVYFFLQRKEYGSSPRVRGTVMYSYYLFFYQRFIPACAGNRQAQSTARSDPTVHPRVCGEQLIYHGAAQPADGSSPRVRGTDPQRKSALERERFIPACAGNRALGTESKESRTVHPRVCGEQFASFASSLVFSGSSPRVRGTAPRRHARIDTRRFIPACAGNSQ